VLIFQTKVGDSLYYVFIFSSQAWEFLSVVSPIFVAFLLTCVSGIPMLEQVNKEKWKGNKNYHHYIETTSRLIPYMY